MTEMSYGGRLTHLADQQRDATAMVFAAADGGETELTWTEIERRSNQVAWFFADRGVTEGDTVAVALRNSPQHVFATFGAWKLGASVLPLRYDLPSWERDRVLGLAKAKAVLGDWDDAADGVITSPQLDATTDRDSSPPPDRIASRARMLATSGSTGRPKLIVDPTPGVYSDADVESAAGLQGQGADAVHLVTSPLYHANGWAACYMSILAGERIVLMERFRAERVVELIERHRITHVIMVPTMLQRIARLPDVGQRDFSSIERLVYGGAPIPQWVVRAWLELIPAERFWLTYGSSEAVGFCVTTGAEWLKRPGTTGTPVGCDLKILDESGDELPTGEVGEIYMRPQGGPSRSFEYVGSETPQPTPDGYWTLGDMGWLDAGGYLYIADRRQDMIVTGGANVFPAEIETALSEHPDVDDAVVVGLPDPEWGRRVHAIVQPVDIGRALTDDDLRAHCKSRLAPYKVPKTFEVIEAIPRSAAGKVNRTALAAERATSADLAEAAG
jgi:bile acid-coenzyme A ligase